MRQQIMDKLRMAGQRVNDFDKAYAARARQNMGDVDAHPLRHMLGGSAISDIGIDQADSMIERILGEAIVLGTKGTNIGYRYGLPAAGVTLGAVGINDALASLFNQGPVEPTTV